MTSIAVLAQREATAEARKGKADMDWRKAWWATTVALGQVEGRKEIGAAQRVVAEATGRSLRWVGRRTVTGRRFATLKGHETLPPRMAVEVSEAGIEVTDKVAKAMVKAEKDGVSLRDFTESLTGKQWADQPGGMSEETITQIVKEQPEVVTRVVVRDQPQQVVREVAQTPVVRRDMRDAIRHQSEEDHREAVGSVNGGDPDLGPEPFPTDILMTAERIAGHLSGATADLERLRRRCEPDQWQRVVEIIEPRMSALTRGVFGEVTMP